MYLEQNNNEVIIERSQPMNETLSDKDKTDDIYYSQNDVATWPEVLIHNMRIEMIKSWPERFQNKEGPFKPAIRVIFIFPQLFNTPVWRKNAVVVCELFRSLRLTSIAFV